MQGQQQQECQHQQQTNSSSSSSSRVAQHREAISRRDTCVICGNAGHWCEPTKAAGTTHTEIQSEQWQALVKAEAGGKLPSVARGSLRRQLMEPTWQVVYIVPLQARLMARPWPGTANQKTAVKHGPLGPEGFAAGLFVIAQDGPAVAHLLLRGANEGEALRQEQHAAASSSCLLQAQKRNRKHAAHAM
jgi:hypothetical protein